MLLGLCLPGERLFRLAQGDIQDHHGGEADQRRHGDQVDVVGIALGFGDEFLHHHKDHGAGGKAEGKGENALYPHDEQGAQDSGQGLHSLDRKSVV